MFDLADHYGYGGRRISSELKAKGIVNIRTGEPFHVKAVTLTRNYGIQVEFNISEAQYLGGMEMG